MRRWLIALVLAGAAAATSVRAAGPLKYRFSFPEPQAHWMQVDLELSDLGPAPLELRMSRSSPGRYALQDFAKNVYDVHALDPDGRELPLERPDASGWNVPVHSDLVTLKYKVFGDQVDGTHLAVDATHAHINMPAAIMWARGLDDRPVTLTFDSPSGVHWQIATQLHGEGPPNEAREPVPERYAFTAPNLQYLMDSPVEFGPLMIEQFTVGPRTFRFAAHHTGTSSELRALVNEVEKIVQQEDAIYGDFPSYEPGFYTFIADYLPNALGDGMEHRDSTVMTSPDSIATRRLELLDTVAHEFFHSWNVERIRPKSLEPFDLDRENTSGELWLAEGFTQYYGPLVLQRAGLVDLDATARAFTALLDAIGLQSGRLVLSAEETSRLAPQTDSRTPSINIVSYYYLGGAIALSLDLSLRERSNGQLSLDDFMREMWRRFGKPGGAREGYVDYPYTAADAEATLAEVSGDPAFAGDFFARYIRGHELANYAELLARAGFIVRPGTGGHLEVVPVESSGGVLTPVQRAFRDRWLGPQ